MADTVLTEVTVMSDYYYEQQNFTNMPELPKLELKIKERGTITVFTSSDYYSRFKTVEFTVSDTEPIENAEITLNAMIKLTDSLGKAKFKLRAGTYNYTITKEGYEPVDDEIIVSNEDINEAVTMSEIVADPIQDLVDEYKSYVTSQGGEFGVSDSALYTEYQDMITKGEITNTGVNTKSVVNYGLWGFKKDGSDNITELYSLCKISGNYLVCSVPSAAKPLYTATYIDMRPTAANRTIQIDIAYAKQSFYVQQKAEIVFSANNIIGYGSNGVTLSVYRHRVLSTGRIEVLIYNTAGNITIISNNNYHVAGQQIYKQVYTRFNDGADKVTLEIFKNGVSFQDLGTNLCDNTIVALLDASSAAGTYRFTSIKYALL